MGIAIVTGANGLVGSEAVRFFAQKGLRVVGIDNDMRQSFFGAEASTRWMRDRLYKEVPEYVQFDVDIRSEERMEAIFAEYGSDIALVLHTAAQPSHDWAASSPKTDFSVNATGTLNLLECARLHSPAATFLFTSTNKVYGDRPNSLPLVELPTRWEIDPEHPFAEGIDESMSIDQSTHSLFGVSKIAADVLVQEYGKYFGLATGVFRGGCLTGPGHSGTRLHGFLSHLVKCLVEEKPYQIFGHKGKQVRDNLHSVDLVEMFWQFHKSPRPGEVYNVGGGRASNCSMLEAIGLAEEIVGRKLEWSLSENERVGDHRWYISNSGKFASHFPDWVQTKGIEDILVDIAAAVPSRVR